MYGARVQLSSRPLPSRTVVTRGYNSGQRCIVGVRVGNVPALQSCKASYYQSSASHFHPPPFEQESALKLSWTPVDDFQFCRASYQAWRLCPARSLLLTRVEPSQTDPRDLPTSKSQANAPSSRLRRLPGLRD